MTLPASGPIAHRAADDALLNVGVMEQGGNNRGKFIEIYQKAAGISAGEPWCAAFVLYRLEQAAHELGVTIPTSFPHSGYTPDYKVWAKEHGVWIPVTEIPYGLAANTIQKGDLCLFYFAAKQRIGHIGIVVEPLNSGFISVEGNTGPDEGEVVNREGDGVFKKRRSLSALGSLGGFARLGF